MDKTRIGIVGLGYWGPNLVRNFMLLDNAEVTAICDLQESNINKIIKHLPNVFQTKDYKELVNRDDVDAVAVATPVSCHMEIASAALAADKHVLIEKPMAASVTETQKLNDLAKKNNKILLVDHTFLYYGAIRKIKSLIESGELGEIVQIESRRVNLGLFQSDVNVLWDLAPHDFSIFDYWLQRPVLRIACIGAAHRTDREDDIHCTLWYSDKLIASLHVSWLSPIKIRQMLICGTKKMVVFDDLEPDEKVKIYDKGVDIDLTRETPAQPIYRSGNAEIPKLDSSEALLVEAEHFIDCIQKGTAPISDGLAGQRVVKLLEAGSESLKQGGVPIKVSYDN